MSNLTVGLGIAAGLVLAAVVAHGAWTTRRNAPKIMRTENVPLDDAPFGSTAEGGPRVDPGFGSALDGALSVPHKSAGQSGASLMSLSAAERKPGLDGLIDVIAPIELDGLVSGEFALAHLPSTRRAGSKPFSVEALNAQTGQWEPPVAQQTYSAFQAGVQLANRSGALNDIEYSEFVQKTQAYADALDGSVQFPDMREEVARGRELDGFAGSHDAQLSFTLRARTAAWSAGFMQQHAAKHGFVPGSIPGRLVLPASVAGGAPLLGLAFDTHAALSDDPLQTPLRAITLSLDVPQVPRSEQAFVRMREVSIGLAAAMDGLITDTEGRVINVDALDAIGADLEKLYDTLAERDLAAGSPQARRLFS